MEKSENNALGYKKVFDKSYSSVIYKDWSMHVVFGDGKKGARPPTGALLSPATDKLWRNWNNFE